MALHLIHTYEDGPRKDLYMQGLRKTYKYAAPLVTLKKFINILTSTGGYQTSNRLHETVIDYECDYFQLMKEDYDYIFIFASGITVTLDYDYKFYV